MLGRMSDRTLKLFNARNVWNEWHARQRCSNNNLTGMESPRVFAVACSSLNFQLPLSCPGLRSFHHDGVSPSGQLHGASIPFEPVSHFTSWGVSWPVVREWEVWEMIGPMREVQREIFVSVAPVVTNPLVAFDY